MLMFDIATIFKQLGESQGVISACKTFAPDVPAPQLMTITMWKHRNRVSAEWLPVVVAAFLHATRCEGYEDVFIDRPRTYTTDKDGLASVGL